MAREQSPPFKPGLGRDSPESAEAFAAAILNDKIQLETKMLTTPLQVRNQGEFAHCCASMAVVACMEILDVQDGAYKELSPLYNYYKARGYGSIETHLTLADAIFSAVRDGVAPQELHDTPTPVTQEAALKQPSEEADEIAKHYQIYYNNRTKHTESGFYPLASSDMHSVEDWKMALRRNNPIAIGIFTGPGYDQLYGNPPAKK